MKPRKTLEERVCKRVGTANMLTPWAACAMVRAELKQLARLVRKLDTGSLTRAIAGMPVRNNYDTAINDVLDLIKQAKQ